MPSFAQRQGVFIVINEPPLENRGGKEPFYEKLGFERRPTETCGAGMMKMVGKEEK